MADRKAGKQGKDRQGTRQRAAAAAAARAAAVKPLKAAPKEPLPKRMAKFFADVRLEMSKVIWPARPELVGSTVVVVVTVTFFTVYIGAMDFVFARLLQVFLDTVGG